MGIGLEFSARESGVSCEANAQEASRHEKVIHSRWKTAPAKVESLAVTQPQEDRAKDFEDMLAILIIPALLVVAALVLVVSLRVLRPDVQHERIRTVANIVSAGAAVTIPIVVYQAAERARISDVTTAKDTRTLQMMIDADHRLSALVDRKADLDRTANAGPDIRFTYKYINGSTEVRTLVRDILNEYEAVCVGVNQGLLSIPVVWAMRGDALLATFSDYAPYIKEHRAAKPQTNATAWTDCDDLATAMRGRRDKLNAQANETKKRQVDLLP